MKLEQQMYEISKIGKERIYQIRDLKNLSATVLYYGEGGGSSGFSGGGFGGGGFGGIGKKECDEFGIVKTPWMKDFGMTIEPIKIGTILPGDLTIKNVGKNTISLQQDFGSVGNIYSLHPDGHGALRFYGLGEGKAKEKKTNSW